MTDQTPTTISDDLQSAAVYESDVEAALRAAARPVQIGPYPNDPYAEKYLFSPPNWVVTPVEPEPVRSAPDHQKGTTTVRTADGFATLVDELSRNPVGVAVPPRFTADLSTLTAIIDPGTLAAPSFEHLAVVLSPAISDELNEWIGACKKHDLDGWARWIEDHQPDIDAAAAVDDLAPGFLDVIQDARTWNVEARRARKRITDEKGGVDDADEYKATVIGKALASFKIRVPILRFGDPVTLTIAIQRDLDEVRIIPRLPGIDRVINAAIASELTRAETALDVVIR